MCPIAIRDCEAADLAQLDWPPTGDYRDHFRKLLERQQAAASVRFLVAECDGDVAGRVVIDFEHGREGEAWVLALAVSRKFRRSGIATKLMSAAQAQAVERNSRCMRLTVAKGNAPACALYDRIGFSCVGEDVSPGLRRKDGTVVEAPEERWILERIL